MTVGRPDAGYEEYCGSTDEPADFDAFWSDTLAESRQWPIDVVLTRVETGLELIEVFDVSFRGYAGQPIKAWLRLPRDRSEPLPAVVQYVGYSRGRGHAVDELLWASAGFAHFQMDTRGQGFGASVGHTPDPNSGAPQVPGVLTRGIERPSDYYYRRVFTDAVRAVEAVRTLANIDASRVAVFGASQGGGIALAVSGLVPDLAASISLVPLLCDFPRAIRISESDPYQEIVRYLSIHRDRAAQVHKTLAYFDGVNFAKRARGPAWFSVGLLDTVCPPSTIYAAFNNYAGAKEITAWEFNGHEGGGVESQHEALRALSAVFETT